MSPHEQGRRPCVAAGALLAATFAAAPGMALAGWTKTYVVEWDEPAVYFGGEGGPADPGTDCPEGLNPNPNWVEVLVKAGYAPETAEWLLDPDNNTLSRAQRTNQIAFRGKNRANVYADPSSTPDPGMVEVVGDIGEGINLDDDEKTGFISPTGEKGIDNQFYRALGCWKFLRGAPHQTDQAIRANDRVHSGFWTLVIVISGAGDDPMNDDEIGLGVYLSPDPLVKGGAGDIARDYTYRIRPHERYEAIFRGKVAGGRITTEATPRILFRDAGFGAGLELLQARADFQIQPNGALKGHIGGYRPWAAAHDDILPQGGAIFETFIGVQMPAVWHALRRNADYSPTGPGGEKTHISYAQRVEAVSAYVTEPDGKALVSSVKSYKSVAPRGEPPIYYLKGRNAVRAIDGLLVGSDADAAPSSLTDEELRPPTAWLQELAMKERDAK